MFGLSDEVYLNLVGSRYPSVRFVTTGWMGEPIGESTAVTRLLYSVRGKSDNMKYRLKYFHKIKYIKERKILIS